MRTQPTQPSPSPWRRAGAATGRLAITATVAALALGAGVAGYQSLAARAAVEDGPPPAPMTSVDAMALTIQSSRTIERRFGGQFEARQETALGFEEGGTVAEILVREGDRVAVGDLLARADTRLLEAERDRLTASRAAMAAQAELARRTNERQTALKAAGHVSAQRVDDTSLTLMQLEAQIAEIDAALASVDVRLGKAEIRAPFDGVTGTRTLDVGAVAGAGAPVVTLLEQGGVRFRAGLDPALAETLSVGDTALVETGSGPRVARLGYLSPDLDPTTRARIAFFDVEGDAPARATGEVRLTTTVEGRGAWVPLQALRQGPQGTWTLLTAEPAKIGRTIGLETAEILDLDEGRAFVRGSFGPETMILPAGTHRVVPGEHVLVTSETGEN